MGLREIPSEPVAQHDIVPSAIKDRMDQALNRALNSEHFVMTTEIETQLGSVLDLWKGQVYRELDTRIRSEVATAETRADLEGLQGELAGATPRQLSDNVVGQERLIQDKIVLEFGPIAEVTADLIAHIAASEGMTVSRTNNTNGPTITENVLFKINTVLLNSTEYIANPSDPVTATLSNIVANSFSQANAEYILGLLDENPHAFEQALQSTLDEISNRGDARNFARNFNSAGLLLAALNQDQLRQLLSFAADGLNQQNQAQRIATIRQIALYTNLPIAVTQGILNDKATQLGATTPAGIALQALAGSLEQEAQVAATQIRATASRISSMNPDVFRVVNPLEPRNLLGFAMSFWGSATVLANTFLAICQGKPETFFLNIGQTAAGLGVATMGHELIAGRDPLNAFSQFFDGLEVSRDTKEAIRQNSWSQVINDNLLSQVGAQTLALWADDKFINVLNSMAEDVPPDRLIRFETAKFIEKLEDAGLYEQFKSLYGDTFEDDPRGLETKLNILANAYRALGITNRATFMELAAVPYGLDNNDVPNL